VIKLRLLACCGALLLPIAAPPTAPAKPGHYVEPRSEFSTFRVPATHGYAASFGTYGHGRLYVDLRKRTSAVQYDVPLRSHEPDRIEAKLPGVGRISVRFHEHSRNDGGPEPGCRGGSEVTRQGILTGVVRLRGEAGFTTVHAQRARGSISEVGRQVCKGEAPHEDHKLPPEFHTASLFANAHTDQGDLSVFASNFTVDGSPEADLASLTSMLFRHRGLMLITEIRAAQSSSNPSWLTVEGAGKAATATVTPPPPFTGEAIFRREEDGSYGWTGPLAVDMPVTGATELAGPAFDATLCVELRCVGEPKVDSLVVGSIRRPAYRVRAAAPTPSPLPRPGSPR
jgi:hypothetical protein